jgi:ferredoxin
MANSEAELELAKISDLASGLEPELGGILRVQDLDRTGFEPELGGVLRQNAVFVDESTCIGCGHCAYVARSTFFLEESYGRARVMHQDGDAEDTIQEAIATCPVDCISWVSYKELTELESARKDQVIPNVGLVGDGTTLRSRHKKRTNHS